jgi:hypothetical protein
LGTSQVAAQGTAGKRVVARAVLATCSNLCAALSLKA